MTRQLLNFLLMCLTFAHISCGLNSGIITTDGPYTIHTFKSNGTFSWPSLGQVELLLVGGGGGPSYDNGQGGGAGGLLHFTNYTLTPGEYKVVVGAGGLAVAWLRGFSLLNPSANSLFTPSTNGGHSHFGNLTAFGGCRAGSAASPHIACGSGAGDGGNGTAGQGHRGGITPAWGVDQGNPGGGGAGKPGGGAVPLPGGRGGHGGDGLLINITGFPVLYAGGGGGGYYQGKYCVHDLGCFVFVFWLRFQ